MLEPMTSETLLIRLLQLDHQQWAKVGKFHPDIDFSYFDVNLLDLVLDAIGLPQDNTVEQADKYGPETGFDHADTFCRDYWTTQFRDRVQDGTPDECAAYISWVRKSYAEFLGK
ncbi:hypothetical protein [Rubrivirga marina]|uniref:Uncharacterized protein n=1 Tax=Rubrivirga marina TaxID=1196024 RepID=A0A271IV57_9BACT|nr:hypothetical protein [Rubrivirga marina]PAP75082.1 hypothetical protein BSZ37_00755 [Rubrivirga marina]PAP75085.1 hypothetical protein BSZ37_00770 [Rubrivirga marina]